MKPLRTACHRGHAFVEGSFRWKSDGTRSCIACERIRHEANRDVILASRARRRALARQMRRFGAEAAAMRLGVSA